MSKLPKHHTCLSIAVAAKFLGVSVPTLRYWDKHGKLKPRRHPMNGYRIYDRAVLEKLRAKIDGSR